MVESTVAELRLGGVDAAGSLGLAPLEVPFDAATLAAALTVASSCAAVMVAAGGMIGCWDVIEPTPGI